MYLFVIADFDALISVKSVKRVPRRPVRQRFDLATGTGAVMDYYRLLIHFDADVDLSLVDQLESFAIVEVELILVSDSAAVIAFQPEKCPMLFVGKRLDFGAG